MGRTANNLGLDPAATAERFQQIAASMPDALSAGAESLPPTIQESISPISDVQVRRSCS